MTLSPTPDSSASTILIVDDHPAVRAGLKNLISTRPGWTICGEATNGDEAVELALKWEPSAIVMDISMPGMNGLEATRRIREHLPGTEIVIVSQHDSDEVVHEAQRAGARGFVVKSHLSADLLPALEAALLHSSRISSPVSKAWHNSILSAKQVNKGTFGDPGPHDDLDLMSGGGEMGALMRSHDWTRTPFGPVSQWPQSLRTALRICLDSRFPILIWWGPELRLLYNDAYRPALGSTKHPQALGAPGKEVWSEIWDTIGPMLEGVVRTGQATWENDQLLLFDRHGYVEESYWTYSYSAIRLFSGEVGGVFSAVHEVTDRVLGARRLKTLREVADQVVQAKTEVSACSLAVQSIGRNPADCPYAMIFLCDDHKATLAAASFDSDAAVPAAFDLSVEDPWAIQKTVETQTTQVFDVQDLNAMPGAPFGDKCKQAISLPIIGARGVPIAVLTIGISPYRALDGPYREFFDSLAKNLAANIRNAQAYDEERKRAEALAELDRAKTVFFSNVSHEFRTPLTLMLGPLEDSLADSGDLSQKHREHLEVAHRNSLRLLRLVNILLDFSRIEAGRIQASYLETDLAKLTAELASVFRSATERAGLRLLIDCPPLTQAAYVDREMWEKIVLNLLSNAFKFTFEGEIEICLREVGDAVELSVRDTGTGIPPHELPHLFERFYRVKGAHGRTFEGSGIGLSLVEELAKLHGGKVTVTSRLNEGSTFTVSIPLGHSHLPLDRIGARRTTDSTGLQGEAYVREALRWLPDTENATDEIPVADLLAISRPLQQGQTEPQATHKARILFADDNADMRDYVTRLLSAHYEILSVPDGEAALATAREHNPDLILSDVMMPRMDGFALLQAVRSDERLKSIPVILLSARAGEESRIEGLQSGADDYLVKPFSARELLTRVRSHLTMAGVRQHSERQLAAEAEALAKLNERSLSLWRSRDLQQGLDDMLRTVIDLLGADRGNVQLYDARKEALAIEAHQGFGKDFLEFFAEVKAADDTACGRALRSKQRVVIPNVELDPGFAPFLKAAHSADYRAVVATPLLGGDGNPLGVISAHFKSVHHPSDQELRRLDLFVRQAADFIQRCKTDEALRQSEERFRAIVDTTPECVKLVDPDGKLLLMNSPGLQMVGAASADDVLGKNVYGLIAPEDRQKFKEFNKRVCAGEKGSLEFDIIGLQGVRRHMESHSVPLHNPDGSVLHLAVTRDISDRKQAEDRERQLAAETIAATAKFRAVFEQTTVFAGIMTKDGTMIDANKLCLEACGYTSDQVLGKMFWETAWWRNFKESQDKIRAATPLAAEGTPFREMLHYSWADGTDRIVDFALYPIFDQDGKVIFLHPTGVDITELKNAEEKFRRLAETLDAEVRDRTRELEIRSADVVRQSEQLRELSWRLLRTQDEERRRIARELHDSAGQTLTVLGINLAQLAQKVARTSPELVADAEMIQETVQQLHREIRTTSYLLHPPLLDESGLSSALNWYVSGLVERSDLDIQLTISDDFGRLPSDMELVVFRLVQESLTNIHRHSGSRTASIHISRDAKRISVKIHDQGKGMSAERLAEVQSRGAGVGIRGIRERLRQFRAKMDIESDSSGTRIGVTIPIPPDAPWKRPNEVESLPTMQQS